MRNNLAHAYLFFGPAGAGKFEAALNFAKKIKEKKGEKDISGIDADLVILSLENSKKYVTDEKRDIKVEHIRELTRKMSLTSEKKSGKIAIIGNAEKMTISAQNSLLKILEEPPQNCSIILVSDDKSRLLSTVVSRCQKVNFNLLSKNRESMLLEENRQFFQDIFFSDVSEKMILAENLSKNISDIFSKIRALELFLRSVILGKKIPGGFPEIGRADSLELYQYLDKSRVILEETNASPRLVLENLFLKIK